MNKIHQIKRIIKLIISVFFFFWDEAICFFLGLSNRKRKRRCVVLYYHSVSSDDLNRFARQLDLMCKLAKPIWSDRPEMMKENHNYFALTFDDGFVDFRENAMNELTKRGIPVHIFIPTGYIGKPAGWYDVSENAAKLVMTEDELRSINKFNIQIGSHCVSHRKLTELNDRDAINEIEESKTTLERILKCEVTTMSFPHGAFRKKHIEYAIKAGYRKIFSINSGLAYQNGDTFLVGRVRTDPEDWMLEVKLKVLGCYRWMEIFSYLRETIKGICKSV